MFDSGWWAGYDDCMAGMPFDPFVWAPVGGWERDAYIRGYGAGWDAATADMPATV